MPRTTHHHLGPHVSIPSNSSPGLLFLASFLPTLDSLSPDPTPLRRFLTATATFTINGGEATGIEKLSPMLAIRAEKLAAFRHEVSQAWDIEGEGGEGKRTVMYESTSITVLKDDPDKTEVAVKEFNIIELIAAADGADGWKADKLRTYMDATPVKARAAGLKQEGSG